MTFSFFLKLPDQSKLQVAEGDQVKLGQVVATYQRFKKTAVNIGQKELTCKLGEKVNQDEILAARKSLFKKDQTKAPVEGQIFSFDQEEGTVIIKTPAKKRQLLSPVKGTIKEVSENQITISLTNPTVLPAKIRGKQIIGQLIPAPEKIFDLDKDYNDQILFADQISPALFKKARVIGVKGVILNNAGDFQPPPTIAEVNISQLEKNKKPAVIINPKQKKIALFDNEA